jgi:hypothetical protein
MTNRGSQAGHVDELEIYSEALRRAESQLGRQLVLLDAAKSAYSECLKKQCDEAAQAAADALETANMAETGAEIATGVRNAAGATLVAGAVVGAVVLAPEVVGPLIAEGIRQSGQYAH